MGVVANICKTAIPSLKAKAEKIAVVRQEAIASILQGGAETDRLGMYYWDKRNIKDAKIAAKKAFEEFEKARTKLIKLQHLEFEMHPEKKEAYVNTEKDLPLYNDGQLKDMFRERVRGVQRMIQVINHLQSVDAEKKCIQALDNEDMEGVYNAISIPVRELVEVALEHQSLVMKQARLTHELSDVTKLLIPDVLKAVN